MVVSSYTTTVDVTLRTRRYGGMNPYADDRLRRLGD
jgi:hypothetical protein